MALKLSGLVSEVKRAIIGLEGRVTRSEFYLTNEATGERIQLCMPPEQVRLKTTSNFRTYNVVERGQIIVPKGERLSALSWSGLLPGANILLNNFVAQAAWQPPRELVSDITRWRTRGDKVKVLITQTPINLDVFIKSFDTTYGGGQGNVKYEIELAAAKDLRIMTVEEADAARAAQEAKEAQELAQRQARRKTGALISKVNNIWAIAQYLTGNGGNWQELARQNGIGTDPTEADGLPVIWN